MMIRNNFLEGLQPLEAVITGGYWGERLRVNRSAAIQHQWDQLEQSGCFSNFRLAAGRGSGVHTGFFFADSDAYKWLDAASLILGQVDDPELQGRVDDFIELIAQAMQPDGYVNTYNQLFFPGERWVNLQIEHELYCLGHLIQAGVSHYQSVGEPRLLDLARRSADLLVREFMDASPLMTDGHEEIELALLDLWQVTGQEAYRELAARLIERRGHIRGYGWRFLEQTISAGLRMVQVENTRRAYRRAHPEQPVYSLPARNAGKSTPLMGLRMAGSALSGKYAQQHQPFETQAEPVGHAVRFAYLQTAAARLRRVEPGRISLAKAEAAWERMVTRRMFVTGGLGALPVIEGFGRDDELDPELAYAETCAALGSMFWNRELFLLTGEPRYDGLLEWQLYNAASVGMSLDGRSYLYNNPLQSRGRVARAAWYDIPCCPSNLARAWERLSGDIYAWREGRLLIRQYLTSRVSLPLGPQVMIEQESGLPWQGRVRLTVHATRPQLLTLVLRIPGWAGNVRAAINEQELTVDLPVARADSPTACGYDPRLERSLEIERTFADGDMLDVSFEMPVRLLRQAESVRGCGGKVALARGPLVYCLESVDNPDGVFGRKLRTETLGHHFAGDLLGGVEVVTGLASDGTPLTFIPYLTWANRGRSQMTVFVDAIP